MENFGIVENILREEEGADLTVALEQAKNSDGFDAMAEGEASIGEEKPVQSKEERRRYADANRKKTIEKLRRREAAMESYLIRLGAKGDSFEQRLDHAGELIEQAKRSEMEQQVRQQAQETGIDANILYKARIADELKQRLEDRRCTEQMATVAEYCHAKNPTFFADIEPEDMKRINLMIRNGFTPQQIYKVYGSEEQAVQPGIAHIKSVGNAKSSGGMDIPSGILKEYERYGFSHADALKDYRNRMLQKSL